MPSIEEANAELTGAQEPVASNSINDANATLTAAPEQQQRYQLWPERLARQLYSTAKSAFTLPGEVYRGEIDPLSEEAIGRSAETALLFSPLSRGATGVAPRAAAPVVEEAIQAGARQEIPIPRFMTGKTSVMPRLAESLRAAPIAGVPIESAGEAVRTGLTRAVESLAPETTPSVAGEAAKAGLTEAIKLRPGIGTAYKGVDELLTNPAATVQLNNVADELSKIMASRAAAHIPGQSPAVKLFGDALADPRGMTYEGIKGLRTYLGEKTPQELVAAGISKSEQKRLYGALTEDLRNSVGAAGGQPALDAWEAANALARQTAQERKALYKIVGAKGDASPELVFSRLTAMAGHSSTADINRLGLAKRTMGPEAWEQFTNGMVSRMGRDGQGQFSPDRFMTAYSKIPVEARQIVFSPEQHRALTDIQAVSKLVQEKASRFMNVSRTAHTAAGLAAIATMIVHPITLLKEIGGGLMLSYWLTRPTVVRAASDAGRASLTGNPAVRDRALQAVRIAIGAEMDRRREGEAGNSKIKPQRTVVQEITGIKGFKKGGRVTRQFWYKS